jgi:membrane fusion protein (multidrug efflux system)
VVLERTFGEGSDVKQGEVLFRIDPAPFQADLDSAKTELRKAQAIALQPVLQEKRYAKLIEANAISAQEYDNARTNTRQTTVTVVASQAAVERALVTEGALVGQDESTPLAVIQQLNPIHAGHKGAG